MPRLKIVILLHGKKWSKLWHKIKYNQERERGKEKCNIGISIPMYLHYLKREIFLIPYPQATIIYLTKQTKKRDQAKTQIHT